MLVSHRKKFIYTKTAKTAGTSVEVYFEKYCMPEGEWIFSHERAQLICDDGIIGCRSANPKAYKWYNHMPASEIRGEIGVDIWDSYFKFCIVRNPFDKLVSEYFFSTRIGRIMIGENEDPIEGFRRFLMDGIPVSGRRNYTIDSRICMDYIIRYEDLEYGIKSVCNRLNLPFEPENIPHIKAGTHDRSIPISSFYTKELRQLVERAYELEMREFGYNFPS